MLITILEMINPWQKPRKLAFWTHFWLEIHTAFRLIPRWIRLPIPQLTVWRYTALPFPAYGQGDI
jgi:hypothetical protein